MTGLAAVWISIAFQAFGKRCNDDISAPKAKQSYKQKHTIPLLTVHFYHVKKKDMLSFKSTDSF